ncbi:MAG: carbon-nitrogen hydrolase family protein [Candidatus Binatia bacterium]
MKFLAAAVQMLATSDKAANLIEAENWVRKASAEGAKLVVLPEVFYWRGAQEEQRIFAEPIPGPTSALMAALARELDIHLLSGSILEASAGENKVYNTSLLFNPQGELLAKYRKIHLFDVGLTDGVAISESETRKAGQEIVVADTEFCPMGLTICYDLRFPELYRRLVERGSQLIFVPSAFTALTGEAHWEPLLRARAIENQVYIIAPDQVGQSPNSMDTYGNSMIVDPWGKILDRASGGPGLIFGEIDLTYLAKVRNELPALSHRKEL